MLKERMVIGVLFLFTAVLMMTVARCGMSSSGPRDDNAHILRPGQSPAAGPSTGSAVSSATGSSAGPTVSPATSGTLYAGSLLVLPTARTRGNGDLSFYSGRTVVGTDLQVLSVPADEGFWVGDSSSDPQNRVWVQLTGGPSESPYDVDRNDHVSFTGKVVKNRSGFARSVGVTDREGRNLLDAEGQHVAVAKGELRLAS